MDGQDVYLAALAPVLAAQVPSFLRRKQKTSSLKDSKGESKVAAKKKELWMGCWMGLEGDGGLQESHIITSELYQDQFTVGLETLTLARLAP